MADILQAVVLCEDLMQSDDDTFSLTNNLKADKQSPLDISFCGKQLLSLLLDRLIDNGVNDVFLCFCKTDLCSSINKIKDDFLGRLGVEVMQSSKYLSPGDVIRDLDARQKLKDHFILTNFDVITNVDLTEALESHKKRYKKSKLNVMTAVLPTELQLTNPLLAAAEHTFSIGLEDKTNRIVWFSNQTETGKLNLDLELLNNYEEILFMTNVYESGLWICAPETAQLFVDNFDFQDTMQFTRGVLDNEEITGNLIHAHFIKEHEFISHTLQSLSQFLLVSSMFLQRLIYPLVPETFDRQISLRPIGSYTHRKSRFDWSTSKSYQSLLCKNSRVSSNSFITHSIIGANCVIGKNVKITCCFLCDGVTVEDGCKLDHVFLSKGSVVKADSIVSGGISFIGQSTTVGPRANITSSQYFQTNEGFDSAINCVENEFTGGEASGFFAEFTLESKVYESFDKAFKYGDASRLIRKLKNSEDSGGLVESSNFSDSDDEDLTDDIGKLALVDYHENFISEVEDSIERNLLEGQNHDNLILEINGSKFANNIALFDVVKCVVGVVMNLRNKPTDDRKKWFLKAQENFNRFKKVILHYLHTEANQKVAVLTIERILNENDQLVPISPNLMLFLYQNDFVSEEAFTEWSNSEPYDLSDPERGDKNATRSKCKEFIEFILKDEDSEDGDDDN